MNFFQALILGIVEGITEFLPISSTGHLILAGKLMGITQTDFVKSFEVIIQLGAILSVLVLYTGLLLKRISLWPKILAAFLPTAVIGFILYKLIKQFLLGNVVVTVVALGLGGIAFLVLEHILKNKQFKTTSLEKMGYKQSLLIGFTQSLSVIPGVSRSAASIFGAMVVGVDRTTAVEFSFLLAIPTMIAATGLDLFKNSFAFTSYEYQLLAVGFVAAFITALITIKAFLGFIKTNTFVPFAWYRIILACLFALYMIKPA